MTKPIEDGGPATAAPTRPCPRCGVSVEATEQRRRLGKYRCKPCDSRVSVESAIRNRERKRRNNSAYHARHSDQRAESTAAYRRRNPLAAKAHQAVQTAVRNGTLVRESCATCGSSRTHAHHDDYERPLDVLWLCHTHHMERHAMLAERKRGGAS